MRRVTALVAWCALLLGASLSIAQNPLPKDGPSPKVPKGKVGLLANDAKAYQGYTLVSPLSSKTSYLLDIEGKIVKSWEGAAPPSLHATLLANGNLLRPCSKDKAGRGGEGGRFQEFTWDGDLVWDYHFSDKYVPHHDVRRLPNGNLLIIANTKKSAEEMTDAGRKRKGAEAVDSVFEVAPKGKDGGEIVWEWHVWDHLIQDNDEKKANYGKVAEHPELIDINFGGEGGGLLGGGVPGGAWTHMNAIDYHADLDHIMLSIHGFSEIWIIDHSTTTKEAAGHTGGKSGKGGDLLYRWGNPRAYRAGTEKDQQLFGQHNAHWLPKGLPGAGRVMLFNNGNNRPGKYSTIDEIVLPVNAKGVYESKPGIPFGPEKAVWSYAAEKKSDFYSQFISGAQRLPNGNTLICYGMDGTIFEVTAKGEIVWQYANPVGTQARGLGNLLGGLLSQSLLFRAYRYGADDPAFKGRKLTPGMTIEESLKKTDHHE